MTTRLWLVRHGETDWSAAGRLNGWRDVALNDRGRAQARGLAHRLTGQAFVGIWSSDLRRSIETARLACGEPMVDRRLRELDFGAIDGLTWGELDAETQQALIGFEGFEAPSGESVATLQARVTGFIAELEAGDHLVFTHGGVIRLLMRMAGIDRGVESGEIVVITRAARPVQGALAASPSPDMASRMARAPLHRRSRSVRD